MKQSDFSFEISLNLFKEVFENVADIAVNLLNNDFTVLWANRTMAVNVEKPLDEMIGKPCYEVWRRRSAPCPEGVLEKTLAERGFKDIRTDRFSVWLETANAEEYWETVVGISGRLQMLLKSIPPDAAAKIKTAVLEAAEGFRAGDIIRIPCEEVIATCRA